MKDIKVHWLKTVDSTNSQAQRLQSESADLTVWSAEFQTAGRGQRGNRWESRAGENLTFSLLLKPSNIMASNQFAISQVATLGILKYLQDKGVAAKIKWPNDIYVGDRKICGMLIENTLNNDKLSASIVGIGLNLNQRRFDSDAPNPTSLSILLDRPFDPRKELMLLLESVVGYYEDLTGARSRDLDTLYHEKLYRLEEVHRFRDCRTGRIITAAIKGVDRKTARLIVESDGQLCQYAFKEIAYIL